MSQRDEILGELAVRLVRLAKALYHLSPQDAEDASQDTIVLLQERYPKLDSKADLVPLSMRILKYKCQEKRRGAGRTDAWPENFDPATNALLPEEHLERDRWLAWMLSVIPQLDERCRRIFELQLREMASERIAELLGLTVNALHVAALRCRRQALSLAPAGVRP